MLSTLRSRLISTTKSSQLHRNVGFMYLSTKKAIETKEWFMWPRETEANDYAVNWSLVGDGVTPTGNAYRNARLPLLTSMLSAKPAGGKVELKSPTYFGDYKIQEAGDDTISMDEFQDLSLSHKEMLTNEKDLFIEDGAIGTFGCVRIGVRMISADPAYALIARSLLVPVPPRKCDHRARFDGWNLDPLWQSPGLDKKWDGEKYLINENPSPLKGHRPVVAYIGGDSSVCAVEFQTSDEKIVGADIIVGSKAPVRAFVEAIAHASSVVINETQSESLALPSASFTTDKTSVIVVGADDATVDKLLANKSLYGAYANVMTESGVSAGFDGFISAPSTGANDLPSVVVNGKAAVKSSPDNLTAPCTHLAFFEKGGKKGTITAEQAVEKVVAIAGESKAELAAALLKNVKCSVVTSVGDVASIA